MFKICLGFSILRGLYVFNSFKTNFGACDKFTTGRTVDLRRECNYNDHAVSWP